MLSSQTKIQFSNYLGLYDIIIPKNHKLRKINELIDFNFILEELKSKYCEDNGRIAIDPVVMFKYLMLKVIYSLSDVDVVEHSRYDMSFKFFLGMMPEDDVIDPSSLCKFRKLRLKDVNLMNTLIAKTVGIAIEHGLINGGTIIVDATHSSARSNPKQSIDHIRKYSKLLKDSVTPFLLHSNITLPVHNVKNTLEKEIKYTENLISAIQKDGSVYELPAVKEKCNLLEEKLDDTKEYCKLLMDEDARIGHKSEEQVFYGYKTHIAMSPERLILSATVTSGEKGDGPELPELIRQTEENGVIVDTVIGDAAYSGQENLKLAEENNIELIAKLNPIISNGSRPEGELEKQGFIFNKDADTYQCPAGHLGEKNTRRRSDRSDSIRYRYRKYCPGCPIKGQCLKQGCKERSISVRILKDVHKNQMELEKTSRFKELAKERYKIEAKNAELKNVLGYKRAISYGLESMQLQSAVTLFVANLKRIIKIEG